MAVEIGGMELPCSELKTIFFLFFPNTGMDKNISFWLTGLQNVIFVIRDAEKSFKRAMAGEGPWLGENLR